MKKWSLNNGRVVHIGGSMNALTIALDNGDQIRISAQPNKLS